MVIFMEHDKTLPSVVCDVKNCVYHSASDECAAPMVKVENTNAENKSETLCGTFECGKNC